jgi:glycine oxidase
VFQADVAVLGSGLIGLACATALARTRLRTLIVSTSEDGAASPASAGILAPSVGNTLESARALGIAARDMYPEYVESLAVRTGIQVPLDRSGVVEVALTEQQAVAIRTGMGASSEWLDAATLREREPRLAATAGGAFHPDDGTVDVPALLDALTTDSARDSHISVIDGRAIEIGVESRPLVVGLEDGRRVRAERVVVAAGAWVSAIRGLPHPPPVVPVRGQMVAFEAAGTRSAVMGPRGYVVQRGNRSLVGSTMEHVGFDARATVAGAALLHNVARELVPALGDRPVVAHWAGLRPVTPDLHPIVGVDPDCDRLLYACGHSKNGVLLAPLTGRIIAELITHGSPSIDITPYAPDRFPRQNR